MKSTIRNVLAVPAVTAALIIAWAGTASAHVVVKPAQVEPAAFQSFSVGVPNEKEVPTIKVRLLIPDGVKYVTPNVKPGWTVETVEEGDGEAAKVKEIVWSGGEVPVGQRDDFAFSLQAPAEATTIEWKAYQTYADGAEVAWDQSPDGGHGEEGGDKGPFSKTEVSEKPAAAATGNEKSDTSANIAIVLAVASLVLSAVALTRQPKAKKS